VTMDFSRPRSSDARAAKYLRLALVKKSAVVEAGAPLATPTPKPPVGPLIVCPTR
jgi:hypothetical protein